MNDPRVKKLKQLTGTMKTARAEMAAGQGSLACLTGVVLAVYSQVDDMRDRWEAEDKRAFRLFDEAMKQQGQASIEDYDGVAEIIEETYRKAHRVNASDTVEGVLKYAWVQIALCNSSVLDAVAFAALMSMIDFYLEPADDFPEYLKMVARGALFGAIPGAVSAADLSAQMEHAYTGERAAQLTASLDRAVLMGLRIGLTGTEQDESAKYWYFGPEDERNRESFCKHMVDKVYTTAMINQCLNGFMTPVWTNCGGPKCRHVWLKVTRAQLADKKTNGYGIDLTDRVVKGYSTRTYAGSLPSRAVYIWPTPPLKFVHIYAPDEGAKH